MYDIQIVFQDFSHVKIECSDGILFELRDYFSFEADGYKFNPKYKYGQWDGRIRLLGYDGLLPIGLVAQAKKFAENFEYKVWVDPRITEKDNLSRSEFDKWLNALDIYAGGNKITPHWYQADSVYHGIVNKRALLNLPTSAGKSLIQCLLSRYYLENMEGKVLIIVPTTSLVTQMIDDFVDYRLFPRNAMLGIRGGTARDSDAMIYVSTWQTAIKQSPEWLQQFGLVMNDECHLATGSSISKLMKGAINCEYKYGLSGSLKDGKANLMQYVGMFGDIFRPVTTAQLMEEGQVTELKINSIFLRYPDEFCTKMKGKAYADEITVIKGSKKRNNWICSLAQKLASKNENVFVMFKHTKHGKEMYESIKAKYKNVYYVSGDVDTDTRDALKKLAESTQGVIVVASYGVFSTGISIKNLHHVIFAHPVKSKVTVLQSIGRVLRKHDSKDIATLWDIVDDMGVKPKSANSKKKYVHLNYALKHALERIQRYAEEKFNYQVRTIDL
ncbi:putative split helicase [Serratia phage 4S]|nr:putative split helicase [Serratia phage 4S]